MAGCVVFLKARLREATSGRSGPTELRRHSMRLDVAKVHILCAAEAVARAAFQELAAESDAGLRAWARRHARHRAARLHERCDRRLPVMRRDLRLLRDVLLTAESQPDAGWLGGFHVPRVPDAEVWEHVALLEEAGWLEADVVRRSPTEIMSVAVWRLTWLGHDFLATVRDERVWTRTVAALSPLGHDTNMDLVQHMAARCARDLLLEVALDHPGR